MSSIDPSVEDLVIRRNRTYSRTFLFTDGDNVPIDLSTKTITAQIRKEESYASDLIADFNVDVSDSVNGNVTISFDETETADIDNPSGYWDMLMEDGSEKESWLEGVVDFKESITNVTP